MMKLTPPAVDVLRRMQSGYVRAKDCDPYDHSLVGYLAKAGLVRVDVAHADGTNPNRLDGTNPWSAAELTDKGRKVLGE